MMRMSFRYILLILLLVIIKPSYAQLNVQAAKALIERIIPVQAGHFEVQYIPEDAGKDVFEIESIGGKIVLRGNNGVSVASALNYYLRRYCHCLVTWNGTNLSLPVSLPVVKEKVHKTTPYKYRYYLNYCTFNYTMSWWDWDQWQWEIDWMALNGINMPLALTGENAIWQKVYKQMGFTEKELNQFFSGPAYFAWFWMGNLDAWGGPLPQHWIDTHEELQKKILARERALGMMPVLPAFTGHVPPSFPEKFPGAKVNKVRWSKYFPAVNILSPNDSLFTAIGRKFLEIQTKEYGTSHFYSADVFNEMKPPTSDSLYLDEVGKKVYQSMYSVDTAAVWVMQGWLFHYDKKFWQPAQIKALFNAVPNDKMILLDLYSERDPMWDKTEGYYGKPWIWNMLHNFGGNVYMEGCMYCVADGPAALLNRPDARNLVGIGLTMEATRQNPAIYQLMLDNTWRNTSINLKDWTERYIHQRYGSVNKNARKAWNILLHSVYGYKDQGNGGGAESIITGRPTFNKDAGRTNTTLFYDAKDLLRVWKFLLDARNELGNKDGYQFDLVDVTRQVLANYASPLQQKVAKAYKEKKIAKFEKLSRQFLNLIDDMDKLLGTRKGFLLGTWLSGAREWGTNAREKDLYEFNARDLITLWGGKDCNLHEYACRQWNGLLADFYKPRWEQFFNEVLKCLKQNKPFDEKAFNKKMEDWEWRWTHKHTKYRTVPKGNPVEISKELFNKYFNIIQSAY